MEVKQLIGEIYSFSKDRKSININGIWLHNFLPFDDKITKGIEYKITYSTKKVGDKEFNNIKSFERNNNEKPIKIDITNQIEQQKKEELKSYLSNEQKEKTASMILSYSKDLCIAYIENVKAFEDLDTVMNKATECLLYSYKKIKSNL